MVPNNLFHAPILACISHHPSAAAVNLQQSAVFAPVGVLDGHPDSSPTTLRFTAFDELTAGLFADEILALATFVPNSGK